MKKRNLILLPLLVLGSTGLSSLVTSCSKLPESVEFATDEAVVVRVGQPVELPGVTVLPEKAEDKTYSFALSSEGIVTLEEDEGKYILTGVAPGEVVITVTSTANPELKDTILVTVPTPDPLPTPVVKTIAELNEMTATDTGHLYQVTGVVSSIEHDQYGNMYLSSSDGSSSILVYGACSDESCFAWTNYNYNNLKFTNSKDFVTSKLSEAIDFGDVITMVAQFQVYNGTKEILGYVVKDSIVKSSTRPNYSASVEVTKVGELGGATLSKTENICLGEELTLTVDIPTDYEAVVKVNGAEIVAESVGVYKFIASFANAVEVSFVEPSAPEGDVSYLMNEVFSDVKFEKYGTYSTTKNGNKWEFSNGGKSKPSPSDVITEEFPMVVSKNGTTTDSYLTISLKYDVVGIDVVSYAWGNNGCNVVCTIETSVDGGTTWVALSNEGSSYTMTDGTHAKVNMSGNFDSTKLVRIHLNTTQDTNSKKKNNRL